jgi:hypothetical protein
MCDTIQVIEKQKSQAGKKTDIWSTIHKLFLQSPQVNYLRSTKKGWERGLIKSTIIAIVWQDRVHEGGVLYSTIQIRNIRKYLLDLI